MDPTFIERLLYEDESATLDFKKEQYKFVKASDEAKSELLKDILGFANGWRRSDAYILIGVEEVTGGRSNVVGIEEHLADHCLQQFVNNLTNRPIHFGYEAVAIGDTQIGVIRVEQQERPIYLKKDFGKLKKDEVYVRRGSSTDPTRPATPDEIAQMGKAANALAHQAELSIEFADTDQDKSLGNRIDWSAEHCEMPQVDEFPVLDDTPAPFRLPGGGVFQMPGVSSLDAFNCLNADYYAEFANYTFFYRLIKKCRFVVLNAGEVAANDVRVEICIPNGQGYGIIDSSDAPEAPKRKQSRIAASSIKHLKFRPVVKRHGCVQIERGKHETKVEIECGQLQPGRKVWSDEFLLGVGQSGEVEITGHLYATNLAKPQEFTLTIDADITRTSMTVEELISIADGNVEADED